MYTQGDPQWRDKQLGDSGLLVGAWGCTMTCVAQALTLAGYPITPGELVERLNANGGFTDRNYPYGGAGLLLWWRVAALYPQFKFQQPGYQFIQGIYGRTTHWILKAPDGTLYDPLFGRNQPPPGWYQTGRGWSAYIEPAPAPVPQPEPVAQEPSAEPETIWVRLTVPGRHVRSSTTVPADESNILSEYELVDGDEVRVLKGMVTGDRPYERGTDQWYVSYRSWKENQEDRAVGLRYIWSGGLEVIDQPSSKA